MILIGAIALAFIVLGVVVVFNGVLYTETLSSADTGQTASDFETTELEVRQGVGCLVAEYEGDQTGNDELVDGDGVQTSLVESNLENDIENYSVLYRNATAHSQPTVVHIEPESNFGITETDGVITIENVTVTTSTDSTNHRYERTIDISSEECPS